MKQLTFSAFNLLIDSKKPTLSDFPQISNRLDRYDQIAYTISCEKIGNMFFWLCVDFGSSLPYGNKVADTQSNSITTNQRKKEHAELNNQIFALYNFSNKKFYISNSNKKKFLEGSLALLLSKKITIARFYMSGEDFVNQLRNVGTIKLTAQRNLMTQQSDLFDTINDTFGLDAPVNFSLDVKYKGITPTEKFKNILKNSKDSIGLDSLVCIGMNDDNIESTFNADTFTEKIYIDATKNTEGLYDEDQIKTDIVDKMNQLRQK